MTATNMFSNFGGFRCRPPLTVVAQMSTAHPNPQLNWLNTNPNLYHRDDATRQLLPCQPVYHTILNEQITIIPFSAL